VKSEMAKLVGKRKTRLANTGEMREYQEQATFELARSDELISGKGTGSLSSCRDAEASLRVVPNLPYMCYMYNLCELECHRSQATNCQRYLGKILPTAK
jgi:hypothetical protein